MPFLALVHLRELRCAQCERPLAAAGARSFIVDAQLNPLLFSSEDPPAEMVVQLSCASGHTTELNVPNEVAAEEALITPEDAPIGADACVVSGTTESGAPLP